MKAPVLKRIAHWARHDLASKELPVGSGQMSELIAAVLGFNSHAAFCQSDCLEEATLTAPALVDTNPALALTRCEQMLPDLKAQRVVTRVREVLEKAGTPDLMFPSSYHSGVRDFVRRAVLQQPRMAGAVDDPQARLRALTEQGFAENDMLRMLSEDGGPVSCDHQMTYFRDGTGHIAASGEYKDARGESGSFELEATFKQQGGRVFLLSKLAVEFKPGEFDELIVDDYAYYDDAS